MGSARVAVAKAVLAATTSHEELAQMADHTDKPKGARDESELARDPEADQDAAGAGPSREADATTQADMGLVGGTGAVEGTGTDEPYGSEGGPEEGREEGAGG